MDKPMVVVTADIDDDVQPIMRYTEIYNGHIKALVEAWQRIEQKYSNSSEYLNQPIKHEYKETDIDPNKFNL